jgi:small subunit ribosomal protein S7
MEYLVFGKWPSNATVSDAGLRNYINLVAKLSVFTQGRHVKKTFGKVRLHIVERLINNMMRGGTGRKVGGRVIRGRGGCGKKIKMYNIAKEAFEIVSQKEKKNPIEVLVTAIENAAPREETTRVKYGGITYQLAVDVSPQRRVDFALRNIARAFTIRSFDNPKRAAEALAEELILASKNDAQSHAVARRIDVERVAKSSR